MKTSKANTVYLGEQILVRSRITVSVYILQPSEVIIIKKGKRFPSTGEKMLSGANCILRPFTWLCVNTFISRCSNVHLPMIAREVWMSTCDTGLPLQCPTRIKKKKIASVSQQLFILPSVLPASPSPVSVMQHLRCAFIWCALHKLSTCTSPPFHRCLLGITN